MKFQEILRAAGLKKADLNDGIFGYSAKKDNTYLIIKDDDEVIFYASVNGRLSAAEFAKCNFTESEDVENCFFGTQSGSVFGAFLSNDGEEADDEAEEEAPAAKSSAKKGKK